MPYADIEEYRAYQKKYRETHKEHNRIYQREWAREKYIKYPGHAYKYRPYDKVASARRRLDWAIRTGNMERRPCEVCGDPNTHAHHKDYSNVYDVEWLCPLHHKEVHHQKDREPRTQTAYS